MKHLFLRRFFPALLCLVLALSLTACGGKEDNTTKDGDEGTKGMISGSKGNVSASKVDPKQAAESLALLQGGLIYSDQTTGAVAYLGQRERRDRSPMTDWLLENCGDLASALPFLLDIPAERVLGAGYGNLYCIVPRDENTSLAVNHITWEAYGNGLHPEADEVLYREEYAQPVLVFVDADEPDIEIVLVTNEGVSLEWIPQIDEYEIPIIPIGDDGEAMLMDFAIFGYTTGLDYGDDWDLENWGPNDGNWEPAGDNWWLPPTDAGLENTTWICDCWMGSLLRTTARRATQARPTSTSSRRSIRNTSLSAPASGAWRTTACASSSPRPSSTAMLTRPSPSSSLPRARRCIFSAHAPARACPSCSAVPTPSN